LRGDPVILCTDRSAFCTKSSTIPTTFNTIDY
jgi:hypothetical protein